MGIVSKYRQYRLMIVKQISTDLVREVSDTYKYFKYGWPSNTGHQEFLHWNHNICDAPRGAYFDMRSVGGWTPLLEDIHQELEMDGWGIQRAYINGYCFGNDAAAHTDSINQKVPQKTAIIYLNDEWDINWGGETVIFENDEIIKSVLPKEGRVFLFDSTLLHGARPLSKTFGGIRKVLVFKYFDLNYTTPSLDFLYQQTKDAEHSGGTFLQHLFNTAKIAHDHNFSEDIIKACFFHSIYGTEYYNFDKNITREEIKEQIGDKAESLVHEFCTLKDRTNTILKSDNIELKQIEFCNLIEQNTHGQYDTTLSELSKSIFPK